MEMLWLIQPLCHALPVCSLFHTVFLLFCWFFLCVLYSLLFCFVFVVSTC